LHVTRTASYLSAWYLSDSPPSERSSSSTPPFSSVLWPHDRSPPLLFMTSIASMSSDTSLYGIRAPKNKHKAISSSTTLAFTSTISSLLSQDSSSRTTSGRPRPSSNKPDIFKTHNKNTKKRALRDLEVDDASSQKHSTHLEADDPSILHRSKRKMEEKARLYSAMKRGDYVAKEGEPEQLIDFDRKWAENQSKNPV